MTRNDRDCLSARVRVIEALEHLEQARRTLDDEDEALARELDDAVRGVDALAERLATVADQPAFLDTMRPEDRRRN